MRGERDEAHEEQPRPPAAVAAADGGGGGVEPPLHRAELVAPEVREVAAGRADIASFTAWRGGAISAPVSGSVAGSPRRCFRIPP